MAAVIFGNRFRGRGVPAWHGIGEVFDNDPSASEAFTNAGMNYAVSKTPIYANVGGEQIEIPDQFAVVRSATVDDDARFLAVVGREFEPVQNMTIAHAIDRSQLLQRYQVETVGALGVGETIFIALSERDGTFEIAGSEVQSYWTVYNGHAGNKALGLMWTPVKTVCSNTLAMAIADATISAKISHGAAAESDLKFWLSLVPRLQAAQEKTKAKMLNLSNFHVNDEQVTEILEAAYPKPKIYGKAQLSKIAELELETEQQDAVDKAVDTLRGTALRQFAKISLARDVFENYANSDGEKGQAGTAWGVYEAVCDVEDHRTGSKVTENIGVSAMFGPRAKSKQLAFAKALELASR